MRRKRRPNRQTTGGPGLPGPGGVRGGSRGVGAAVLLLASALWAVAGTALAQEGGAYIGVTGAGERLGVFYEKAVDNTDPRNVSPSRGQVYRADDTSAGGTYRVGFLAGYRFPVGASGFLSAEADVAYAGGAVRGHFEGAGFSADRTQLGESWPEDWTVEERTSYGATLRAGAGVGSGWSLYGLAGVRRLDTRFSADFTGCFLFALCGPGEFVSGTDVHDQAFTGWTTGAGLEKRLGRAAIRGEVRYTDYGSSAWVVPYDDLAITVPLALEADGVGASVSLLWYF